MRVNIRAIYNVRHFHVSDMTIHHYCYLIKNTAPNWLFSLFNVGFNIIYLIIVLT